MGQFGRNDLKEYQELDRNVSVGNSEISGVSVDCRFNFSKTRWGVLENQPGGIFYMDLTINQPLDWRLREATISVILDDLTPPPASRAERKAPRDVSVQVETEYFGPKSLVGPQLSAETTKSYNIGPQIEAAGVSGSLGEFGSSVTLPQTAWWNFHGTPMTAKGSFQRYTILTWVMSQNSLAYSAEHPAKIETAFTFSHKYRPFTLRVEIDGKMRHRYQKCKDKAFGLFTRAKRDKPLMLVFRFDPGADFKDPLLQHARLLESDMAKIACQRKHVEVAQRVSSKDLLDDGTIPQGDQSPPTTHIIQPAEPPLSIKQDDLTAELLRAHATLLSSGTLRQFPPALQKPLSPQVPVDTNLSAATNEVLREEVVEALQRMPVSTWWMFAIFLRFWAALPTLIASQKEKDALK